MVGPVRPQFVLFGSSIVQLSFDNGGWGAILADIYARKADIVLRGYNGWNTRLALEYIDQIFPKDASVQPSLVMVYFGGNDSVRPHPSGTGPHVPIPEYKENMRRIAKHLKSLSEKTRIIFLSCPPVGEKMFLEQSIVKELIRTNEGSRQYSEACIEVCQEMDLKCVDLWTSLQKLDDWTNTFSTDGLHLSPEGSKVVAEEILKILKEADWEPSLHWKSLPTEFAEDSPHYSLLPNGKGVSNPSDWRFHWKHDWN